MTIPNIVPSIPIARRLTHAARSLGVRALRVMGLSLLGTAVLTAAGIPSYLAA